MGRKILFVTTDQQRYDTLGCNGGTLARTPVVDALAAAGHPLRARHPQSVVCMPSRSTILTGQHPSTHGVWMNGVPCRSTRRRSPSVLHDAGYRTALDRQAALRAVPRPVRPLHREPLGARDGAAGGTHRGFEHLEFATHGAVGPLHYARWLAARASGGGRDVLPRARRRRWRSTPPAAATPARRRCTTTRSRADWYHTDWVADRTIAWLDSLGADDDWFCWMSFPDPHHPWDPPAVGGRPRRLARRAAAGRLPRDGGRARAHPRRQAAPLAGLVRRHARVQLRGARTTGCRRR